MGVIEFGRTFARPPKFSSDRPSPNVAIHGEAPFAPRLSVLAMKPTQSLATREQTAKRYESAPFCEIASSTLGGDIGSSVMRMSSARLTAFPIAASGATMGVSPQPRTP